MKEERLGRLEKLNQVRNLLFKVIVIIFFSLVLIFLILSGSLSPFYLPIPDAITICLAGVFTACCFFGAFGIGEIAFEISDTRRVLAAKKYIRKALVYGVALLAVGGFMFHPALYVSCQKLVETHLDIGYGKYFNITFTPRDAHGFSFAENMSISVSNGKATIIIAELKAFNENYESGSYYKEYNQTLENTTVRLRCSPFLKEEKITKEFVIYIEKQPNTNVKIEITKSLRSDAMNAWGLLLLTSGALMLSFLPVFFGLKKKFEKGSVVK